MVLYFSPCLCPHIQVFLFISENTDAGEDRNEVLRIVLNIIPKTKILTSQNHFQPMRTIALKFKF